jgi:hypothetical protein
MSGIDNAAAMQIEKRSPTEVSIMNTLIHNKTKCSIAVASGGKICMMLLSFLSIVGCASPRSNVGRLVDGLNVDGFGPSASQAELLNRVLADDDCKTVRIVEVSISLAWAEMQVYDRWVERGAVRCVKYDLQGKGTPPDDAIVEDLYVTNEPRTIAIYHSIKSIITSELQSKVAPVLETTSNPNISWIILPEDRRVIGFSGSIMFDQILVPLDEKTGTDIVSDWYIFVPHSLTVGHMARMMLDIFDVGAMQQKSQ